MHPFEQLQRDVITFRDARDWAQFHDPKNLAEAISIEAAELLENFLWKTPRQSEQLDDRAQARVSDEISDLLLLLLTLCHQLDIDLLAAAQRKLADNARKYPVDKARGNATKYTDL